MSGKTRAELLTALGCKVDKPEHDWCEDRACEHCWPSGKYSNHLFFEMHYWTQAKLREELQG